MDLQYLDVKLPLEQPERPDLGVFIPVFHRWVREQLGDGLLIDVADYRHVFGGPGIVLVGHDGNYSLDMTGNRAGLRYVRKTTLAGGPEAVLAQALQEIDRARTLLETDPIFAGRLRFNTRHLELRINDRLLAPSHPDTFAQLQPVLHTFFSGQASGSVQLDFRPAPRETLRVSIQAETSLFPVARAA